MAEETKEPVQKKGKGMLIIILLLLIILLGGGAAAYFLVLKKPADESEQTEQVAEQAPVKKGAAYEPGPVQTYPPFLVNLADPGGNRYLKVTLSLELSKDKNFQAEITAKEPKIMDTIITVLASKTFEEVSTTQGKIALKQEIIRKLNSMMTSGRITDVFITEFVVQ